jgi:RNA polymerase sigma factor (sigma-70 family)
MESLSSKAGSLSAALWDCYILTMRQWNHEVRRKRLSIAGRRGGVKSAWRRWHRENAILERMPEVRRLARRVRRLFTHHVDIEELEQAGCVGLVSAANSYDPCAGPFPPYAYWRVRGEMVDSQKRRVFREAAHMSLSAIAEAHDGWLPPEIDTSPEPLIEAVLTRDEVSSGLKSSLELLEVRPGPHGRVFELYAAGVPAREIGWRLGLSSATETRVVIREAQAFLAQQLEG